MQADLARSFVFMDSSVSESSKSEEIILPEILFLTPAGELEMRLAMILREGISIDRNTLLCALFHVSYATPLQRRLHDQLTFADISGRQRLSLFRSLRLSPFDQSYASRLVGTSDDPDV